MAAVSFVRMDYEFKNKVKRTSLYSFQRLKLDWIASEIVEIHLWLKKITIVTQKSPWDRKDVKLKLHKLLKSWRAQFIYAYMLP